MTRVLQCLMFVVVIAGMFGCATAWADSSPLKPFFGTYEGASLAPSAEVRPRDLKVSIKPADGGGFFVEWQTTLFKPLEEARRKTQSLEFRPTRDNPVIYQAVPSDVTAGMEPSESPLDGGPFAWARVLGQVLTVNILTIAENGDYVIQSYDRALTKDGMALAFVKVRNGHMEQRLWGVLERTDG